jgi:hypothetical protein
MSYYYELYGCLSERTESNPGNRQNQAAHGKKIFVIINLVLPGAGLPIKKAKVKLDNDDKNDIYVILDIRDVQDERTS